MIKVEKLTFDYPNKRALDNISFEIEPQTITALVGPNGAGKTTLLRTLAALDTPLSGKMFIDNYDVLRFPKQVHRLCSFLPDFYGLYDSLTVVQCLTFTGLSYHLESKALELRINTVLEKLNLNEYRNSLAGHLSRGLRQRLAIAQAIIYQPKVLFLDEPAAGLDPEARMQLSTLLRSLCTEGMTLIVSSHILSELEDYSTHMMIIKNGKLIKHCALDLSTEQASPNNYLKISLTALDDSILKALSAFKNITLKSTEKLSVIVRFDGDIDAQHQLLKELIAHNIPVCGIQVIKPSMAQVYLDASYDTSDKK
ncbi:MAG: ABC transporter ATP-binding protein [Candidatus Berkiella sp.]